MSRMWEVDPETKAKVCLLPYSNSEDSLLFSSLRARAPLAEIASNLSFIAPSVLESQWK